MVSLKENRYLALMALFIISVFLPGIAAVTRDYSVDTAVNIFAALYSVPCGVKPAVIA